MDKYLKFALYALLIIAIIVVASLMLGNPSKIDVKPNLTPEVWTFENEVELVETPEEVTTIEQTTPSFEEDVMKDLESYFGSSNWYENVWWDFWFTNEEAN